MQTNIHGEFAGHARIEEADSILRSCVHCGFCNATCPTYLELGDERDGPRGRIYLIKSLLEGNEVTRTTQTHLDRCLTCLNCETTCPSGVQFGRLADIGRDLVEQRVERPASQRVTRWLLKQVVPYRRRFGALLGIGRALRPMLPAKLAAKVPRRRAADLARPAAQHPRVMLALEGCAQAAATPATNAAAARVLDRLGVQLTSAPSAGCCGALHYHLADHDAGLDFARRNIDAWWPAIERGAEAIVITASGCGAMVKEYGHLLRDDPRYAAKAERVTALAKDLVEVLGGEDLEALGVARAAAPPAGAGDTVPAASAPRVKIAFQSPCTLQHGQKLGGTVEALLERCGFELIPVRDAHLCCGSAGSYSLLQPQMSRTLRDNKLAALTAGGPDLIATANVGCQLHLETAAEVPVRHWVELLDATNVASRADGSLARSKGTRLRRHKSKAGPESTTESY